MDADMRENIRRHRRNVFLNAIIVFVTGVSIGSAGTAYWVIDIDDDTINTCEYDD